MQAAYISGTTVSDYKKTRCHSLKHHNRIQSLIHSSRSSLT